jgi:hypothetical protein
MHVVGLNLADASFKETKSALFILAKSNYGCSFDSFEEYVITIACMIGKSRMKGEKVVTNLVPYGPEKPRSGMVRSTTTKQVWPMFRIPLKERIISL